MLVDDCTKDTDKGAPFRHPEKDQNYTICHQQSWYQLLYCNTILRQFRQTIAFDIETN